LGKTNKHRTQIAIRALLLASANKNNTGKNAENDLDSFQNVVEKFT
jgi:hypothetical protein